MYATEMRPCPLAHINQGCQHRHVRNCVFVHAGRLKYSFLGGKKSKGERVHWYRIQWKENTAGRFTPTQGRPFLHSSSGYLCIRRLLRINFNDHTSG